jgi:hypothetical protein
VSQQRAGALATTLEERRTQHAGSRQLSISSAVDFPGVGWSILATTGSDQRRTQHVASTNMLEHSPPLLRSDGLSVMMLTMVMSAVEIGVVELVPAALA